MNNAAVLYFNSEFGLSTEDASTLGFIYGSMNLVARGLGGMFSDRLNIKMGMRGRLWLQTILLILEGAMILIFAFSDTLPGAVVSMCVFSILLKPLKEQYTVWCYTSQTLHRICRGARWFRG